MTDGYLYNAYGVGLARTGSTVNSFLFQGQQYDAASGTYYLRARYYDQNGGRFISQDPFEGNEADPVSLHRYLYANSDPINNLDPSGEETLCELSVSLGINTSLTATTFTLATRFYNAANTLADAITLYQDWEATGTVDTGDAVNLAFDLIFPKLGPALFKGIFGKFLCFTAGTPVVMADGHTKAIEKVRIGDLVLSRDAVTGRTQAKKVVQLFQHQTKQTLLLHFRGGATIETTPTHPFYVQGKGFVPAGQLAVGTSIVTRAGPNVILERVERRSKEITVYNFEVQDFHTYFVGEDALWVHNACRWWDISPVTNDWAKKGAHILVDIGGENVELAIRPGTGGALILTRVFSGTSAGSIEKAIEKAQPLLQDTRFLVKLLHSVTEAKSLVLHYPADGGVARSGELHFLQAAIKRALGL